MSIIDLRNAFNEVSVPAGVRCTSNLLLYGDAEGLHGGGKRDHQILVFNCVRSTDNTTHQYISDPLPPGASLIAAAQALANKAIGAG